MLVKEPEERLGMHIKGGLNGVRGNPYDSTDEGVFVSKINSSGAARRDGRLKVGMRLLEVNGVSLLGATHQEAVDCLRGAGNDLYLVVCKGYDKTGPVNPINITGAQKVGANGDVPNGNGQQPTTTGGGGGGVPAATAAANAMPGKRYNSRASETGSELSHSISSLDRDDDAFEKPTKRAADVAAPVPVPQQNHVAKQPPAIGEENDVSLMSNNSTQDTAVAVNQNSDRSVAQMKEKSTPEKVTSCFYRRSVIMTNRSITNPLQVLDIVRAAESLAMGGPGVGTLIERPLSPVDFQEDKKQKTTTIVMSKHTLDTQVCVISLVCCYSQILLEIIPATFSVCACLCV